MFAFDSFPVTCLSFSNLFRILSQSQYLPQISSWHNMNTLPCHFFVKSALKPVWAVTTCKIMTWLHSVVFFTFSPFKNNWDTLLHSAGTNSTYLYLSGEMQDRMLFTSHIYTCLLLCSSCIHYKLLLTLKCVLKIAKCSNGLFPPPFFVLNNLF